MGRLTCSICKKKKPLIGMVWNKCSRHGVICNKCKVGSIITKDKCPKCGNVLKMITD